jgi:hypothetical protein
MAKGEETGQILVEEGKFDWVQMLPLAVVGLQQ